LFSFLAWNFLCSTIFIRQESTFLEYSFKRVSFLGFLLPVKKNCSRTRPNQRVSRLIFHRIFKWLLAHNFRSLFDRLIISRYSATLAMFFGSEFINELASCQCRMNLSSKTDESANCIPKGHPKITQKNDRQGSSRSWHNDSNRRPNNPSGIFSLLRLLIATSLCLAIFVSSSKGF
jgi:hypothetical protein